MRSEVDRKIVIGKRLLADDGQQIVTSNAVVNLFGDAASQDSDEPPVKIQIGGGQQAAAVVGGAVNNRLELILGDRSSQARN